MKGTVVIEGTSPSVSLLEEIAAALERHGVSAEWDGNGIVFEKKEPRVSGKVVRVNESTILHLTAIGDIRTRLVGKE